MLPQILKNQIRKLTYQVMAPVLQEQQSQLEQKIKQAQQPLHDNPNIAGKLFSYGGNSDEFIVEKKSSPKNGRPFAVPPPELWEGYAQSDEDYLEYGEKDMQKMLRILGTAGESAETLTKVLDLGCAAGRMLRHYPYHEGKSELWGCDINAHHINWCQQHLSPPFLFATTSTVPHLPFEDNSFDLVYCGSVFTHISDLADAWLLEIRRILRKGGYAFITIHDKHTYDLMLNKYIHVDRFYNIANNIKQFHLRTGVGDKDYAYFSVGADPASQVYYDVDYLMQKWSRFVNVISVNPETYNYQTAVLLQKKP